jgi:hypothetical protein
VGG